MMGRPPIYPFAEFTSVGQVLVFDLLEDASAWTGDGKTDYSPACARLTQAIHKRHQRHPERFVHIVQPRPGGGGWRITMKRTQ